MTVTPSTPDPDFARLASLTARADTDEQVLAAGYAFDQPAERFTVGADAYVYSRGCYRHGLIAKVGRLNATVRYTTETAVHYGTGYVSTASGRFAHVAIRPPAPTADASTTNPPH